MIPSKRGRRKRTDFIICVCEICKKKIKFFPQWYKRKQRFCSVECMKVARRKGISGWR